MARSDQEAIDTFMSITGVSEDVAIQKLEEHRGDINEAVNAHFSEGDRGITQQASFAVPRDDHMDIEDPGPAETHRSPSSLFPFSRGLNPFSLLDPNFTRSFSDTRTGSTSRPPFVSHPREVREIPIEVKDGIGASGLSANAPVIEDVTETEQCRVSGISGIHGTVIMEDDDDVRSDPTVIDVPDYGNDIEEEMIRAAIEASKQETAISNQQRNDPGLWDPSPLPGQSDLEDPELARAVSLSLQTAEREKALRELVEKVEASEREAHNPMVPNELREFPFSNGKQPQLEVGSSLIHDEAEDVEDLPLVRHRRRRVSSPPVDVTDDIEEVEVIPPSSPQQHNGIYQSHQNPSNFPSDEWSGISPEEHEEAVMLEAAMFGGIPEGSGYHLPYAPHQFMHNGPSHLPRPPSPSLTTQRLLREQQDDEYHAALQADREKVLKAKEEAEAALAEERRKEEELCRQLQEEQENDRQLAAKEASLPQEPAPDDENAVTLLVRMPDGRRRGRRFRKSDKLQVLFDFIDVGRVVKPRSYRLVRPYPRRAFSDGDSTSTLNELGMTSKQEALYLELL